MKGGNPVTTFQCRECNCYMQTGWVYHMRHPGEVDAYSLPLCSHDEKRFAAGQKLHCLGSNTLSKWVVLAVEHIENGVVVTHQVPEEQTVRFEPDPKPAPATKRLNPLKLRNREEPS